MDVVEYIKLMQVIKDIKKIKWRDFYETGRSRRKVKKFIDT